MFGSFECCVVSIISILKNLEQTRSIHKLTSFWIHFASVALLIALCNNFTFPLSGSIQDW